MGLLRNLKLKARFAKRLGAYARARQQGMGDEQARQYVDQTYLPTPDDLKYEREQRRKKNRPSG